LRNELAAGMNRRLVFMLMKDTGGKVGEKYFQIVKGVSF
jgi:hypothetical protein